MTRLVIGPFNRVEGDLEVTLDIAGGVVRSAEVNASLFRGFEQILAGRDPFDALVYAPRICGICSVSQSAAAAAALANSIDVHAPPNGALAVNLIVANENLADHLTHFYLFFMPDFAREVYRGKQWHESIASRFTAAHGSATREVLPVRAGFLQLMGYLAGKWPHTLAIQPGGSARAIEVAEKLRILALVREFRGFLETTLFGDSLESFAALSSEAELDAWADDGPASDLRRFLAVARDLSLHRLGRGVDRFMSYGAYPIEGEHLFKRGIWEAGQTRILDTEKITEDLSHSWMEGPRVPLSPRIGVTRPAADKPGAYSWCKAPRLGGAVVETGAFARQVVDGNPLIADLMRASGSNVKNRVVARMVELALVVPRMEAWLRAIVPGEPFNAQKKMPADAEGIGLVEAARGSLGHWLAVSDGRIANYQIVAPTTWNFSPRDAAGNPGVVEQALVGVPAPDGETTPVAVQHVVRSFDPCMVCTVH